MGSELSDASYDADQHVHSLRERYGSRGVAHGELGECAARMRRTRREYDVQLATAAMVAMRPQRRPCEGHGGGCGSAAAVIRRAAGAGSGAAYVLHEEDKKCPMFVLTAS